MSRYTVIGGSGFVGSHAVTALRSRGIEPLCPARGDPALWTEDLGHVIYCAGMTGNYRTNPFPTVESHVCLLARLLERASFDRIVYLSSTRIYGLLTTGICTEDRAIPVDPLDVEQLYELTKMLGENLTVHRSGGRGVVARLSYVFDWDDHARGFLSEWLQQARKSRAIVLDSSPDGARDYIHADDAAAALITLVDSNAEGIVNVARGETLSNAAISTVFTKRGWTVDFSSNAADATPPAAIDTTRLEELGAAARPVLP